MKAVLLFNQRCRCGKKTWLATTGAAGDLPICGGGLSLPVSLTLPGVCVRAAILMGARMMMMRA